MMTIEINGFQFIRQAESLLKDGKANEAIDLIERNTNGELLFPGAKLVYARCLYAIGELQKARNQLMGVITEDPEYPAALEFLMEIHKKSDDSGREDYYRSRLAETMQFVKDSKEFWKSEADSTISDDSNDKKSIDNIDKEALINSINRMLGKEAELTWPFETITLAELFIKQGHMRKGLAVYNRLLRTSHNDEKIIKRVKDLLKSHRDNDEDYNNSEAETADKDKETGT